jgi:site-specific recombinase XerD
MKDSKGVIGMPYGFIQSIENKGYSTETLKSYQKVIQQFFNYIMNVYPTNKEPFQISPSDIRNFLKEQQEKGKSISTINKELAILKTMFHYFWEIDKVPVDPAVKLKRLKVNDAIILEVSYQQIIEVLQHTLQNESYSPLRKAIFLLATKGLKTADFRFKKSDVNDKFMENKVEIQLRNRSIILKGSESSYFQDYYYHEARENGSEFVFITKPHGEEVGGSIQVMSILSHLRAISHDYLLGEMHPLTLISIRRALAYDLFKKRYSIQQLAKELGIEESTASNYLKQIIEGISNQKSSVK